MTTEQDKPDSAPAAKKTADVTPITPDAKPDAAEAAALAAKLDAGFFADITDILSKRAQLKEPTRENAVEVLKQYIHNSEQLLGENQKLRGDNVRLRSLVRETSSFL